MAYETIRYQSDDRVAVITLDRPERMNAFSQKLCAELSQAIQAADQDSEVRVLIITGAGGKAFSAGYDIKESAEAPRRGVAEWRERLNRDLQFTYTPWNCSKPVIAMIDGYCLAGALEFAQMCDIRYCSDHSKFGVVETRFANGIATYIMPWILGNRCRELIYTGDTIDAERALRLGLVDRVFPRADLERETMKIARRMSRVALAALQWNKRAINNTFDTMGLRGALQYGVEACTLLDVQGTPEYSAFDDIRRSRGLGEALRWRDAQFAPFE
jgi:enoyl-CoA hydratase/carnithine racemase